VQVLTIETTMLVSTSFLSEGEKGLGENARCLAEFPRPI
jgi:hypothetical protein